MADDWFAAAASEAAKTEAAKKVAARSSVIDRLRQEAAAQRERIEAEKRRMAASSQKSRGEVASAAGEFFAAVAAGVRPPHAPGYASGGYASGGGASGGGAARMTPDAALGVIEDAVRRSADPYLAAGEWISKITNALSAIAREYADEG